MEKQNNTSKRISGPEVTQAAAYAKVNPGSVYNYLKGKELKGATKVAVEKAIKRVERERK